MGGVAAFKLWGEVNIYRVKSLSMTKHPSVSYRVVIVITINTKSLNYHVSQGSLLEDNRVSQ